MGPLQWWWRSWSKVIDPSREQEMAGALAQAEEQRQRADRLASELAGRDSKVGALEKRADKAGGELQRVQARLSEAEGREAELQSRVDELRGAQAEVDDLRARLEKADNEIENLRTRLKEADNELKNQRQRAEKADNELKNQRQRAEKADNELKNQRQRAEKADADRAEAERLRARVEELEASQQPADSDQSTAGTDQQGSDSNQSTAGADQRGSDTGTAPDVSGAAAVLGKSIDLDDLTVIEGVGPKIASLLGDAGISTWRDLSDAEPDRLRSILQDAGPRFRVHDPESWPRQAALLADGKWQEFKDLRAEVRSR